MNRIVLSARRTVAVSIVVMAFHGPADDAFANDVVVTLLNGSRVSGRLERLSNAGAQLVSDSPRIIAAGSLLRIDTDDPDVHIAAGLVLLANGDRLAVKQAVVSGENLIVDPAAGNRSGPARLPLEYVQGVIFSVPELANRRERLLKLIRNRTARDDLILLANGDRLSGRLLELNSDRVELKHATGRVLTERKHVCAVLFDPELQDVPDLPDPRAVVVFADGSRLTSHEFGESQDGRLRVSSAATGAIEIRLDALVSVRWLGGRTIDLSEVAPVSVRHTPVLGPPQAIAWNRSVDGSVLRMRGREFARGLGMHGGHQVTWRLDGRYAAFRATVGIDDSTAGGGSVRFRVVCDGRTAFESRVVTGVSPALEIPPVDITECQQLTLTVDSATGADMLDRADWCDAVLVRGIGASVEQPPKRRPLKGNPDDEER